MSEQDTINGEEELNRWFTASTSIDANLPIEAYNENNAIFQYDKNTNTDKVLVPLDTGGYVSVGSKPAEFMSTPSSNKMMSVAVPKYSNGRGYDNYFNNLGRAGKVFTDPIVETVKTTVSGVGQGIDMATDMMSDFLGKYMQFKFDPNLFDGKSLPDINPKQMLMDATGFQGVDLSAFEPETTPGQIAKDFITYLVAATLTPSKGLGLVKGGMVKGAGSLGATAPEFGNLFTLARDLGFENDIVAYLDAKIENPEDATLDERLASRLKGMFDAPLEAGILYTAYKTIANRAVRLTTGAAAGTALTAQEAEGGPLATFVRQSLKRGVRQVDSVPQPKIDPQDNIARIEAPTDNEPGIIAFHGSGADFDEFKLDKIGTGEGAQKFGYGLYFSENEDIAKFYKNNVLARKKRAVLTYDNQPIKSLRDTDAAESMDRKTQLLDDIANDVGWFDQPIANVIASRIKRAEDGIKQYKKDPDELSELIINSYQNDLKILNQLDASKFGNTGKTYKVELLPKQEELLDYDLPFSKQTDFVKNALRKASVVTDDFMGSSIKEMLESGADIPGKEIIETLRKLDGTGQASSQFLNKFGIKGITLSETGRKGIQPITYRNYVIFDDAAVNILAKYGIAGPVAVTALSKPEFTKNEQ